MWKKPNEIKDRVKFKIFVKRSRDIIFFSNEIIIVLFDKPILNIKLLLESSMRIPVVRALAIQSFPRISLRQATCYL